MNLVPEQMLMFILSSLVNIMIQVGLIYTIKMKMIIFIIGKVPLATSKTHKDPFESGHTDVFEIEAMDIGEPKKIKYE
jgi:tetrahydromethanopterin S-methyltransferase subunit D